MYGFFFCVIFEGFSWGGLFVYNWVVDYLDKVVCIYVDVLVCDVFSWLGCLFGNVGLWKGMLDEWGLIEVWMNIFFGNLIDWLKFLVDVCILVICVCGDSDRVVLFFENLVVVC